MPTSHGANSSQAAEEIRAGGRRPRMRPQAAPRSRPELPTPSAVAAGKRPSSRPSDEQSRKKIQKAAPGTPGIANQRMPVKVTSHPLREGRVDNHLSPPSTAASGSTSFPPSQSSGLGSVASFTGRAGPRSALHSGSLELASVLESVKRLLERYCLRVAPFIAPGEEMIDVSAE
jgi:hypothetical protein